MDLVKCFFQFQLLFETKNEFTLSVMIEPIIWDMVEWQPPLPPHLSTLKIYPTPGEGPIFSFFFFLFFIKMTAKDARTAIKIILRKNRAF